MVYHTSNPSTRSPHCSLWTVYRSTPEVNCKQTHTVTMSVSLAVLYLRHFRQLWWSVVLFGSLHRSLVHSCKDHRLHLKPFFQLSLWIISTIPFSVHCPACYFTFTFSPWSATWIPSLCTLLSKNICYCIDWSASTMASLNKKEEKSGPAQYLRSWSLFDAILSFRQSLISGLPHPSAAREHPTDPFFFWEAQTPLPS